MRTFKWRIILSLASLFVAVGLSALGLQEYEAFRQSQPGAVYHGHHAYLPTAQLISYSMNAPVFLLTNLLGTVPAWRLLWRGKSYFYYVSAEFYVLLSLFWWWIGWRLDVKSKPDRERSLTAVVGYLSGALIALALLCSGIYLFTRFEFPSEWVPGGRAIPLSLLLWGTALLCYFGRGLLRSRTP